jgi:hypothetical protein
MAETRFSWQQTATGELGDIDDRFYSCPVRTWSGLFEQKPPPPYPRKDWTRIPLDVHVPGFEELSRAWRALCHGSVSVSLPDSPGPGTLPRQPTRARRI